MTEQNSNKRKRGRPSSQQKIDFDKIFEVAANLFAKNGFEGTKMNAIAAETGYNKSLMNYHFKGGKEELWKKTVGAIALKLHQRFQEIEGYFKDLNGLPLMKALNRQFIYFSAEQPTFFKIVFHEMCTQTDRTKWLLDTVLQPMHEVYENGLLNAKEHSGLLEGIPPAHIASLTIGAGNIFFTHAFQFKHQYGINSFDKKEIERYADFVNETIFARFEK